MSRQTASQEMALEILWKYSWETSLNAQKINTVEDKLICQPDSPIQNSWMNHPLVQREKRLLFNQKYWSKLKRKEWLIYDDRNSRYFQQWANNRRKKKLACKLKDGCGVSLDDQRDIVEKFMTDYNNRFKSNQANNRNLPDLQLPNLISNSDNMELIKLPDMEEVKLALFSIDSNKTLDPDGFGVGFFKHYWAW